jgi:hypothetical protein
MTQHPWIDQVRDFDLEEVLREKGDYVANHPNLNDDGIEERVDLAAEVLEEKSRRAKKRRNDRKYRGKNEKGRPKYKRPDPLRSSFQVEFYVDSEGKVDWYEPDVVENYHRINNHPRRDRRPSRTTNGKDAYRGDDLWGRVRTAYDRAQFYTRQREILGGDSCLPQIREQEKKILALLHKHPYLRKRVANSSNGILSYLLSNHPSQILTYPEFSSL